jgi:hypothetical protein
MRSDLTEVVACDDRKIRSRALPYRSAEPAVNGDPLKDIAVLQDRSRLSVMKGGRFVTRNLS